MTTYSFASQRIDMKKNSSNASQDVHVNNRQVILTRKRSYSQKGHFVCFDSFQPETCNPENTPTSTLVTLGTMCRSSQVSDLNYSSLSLSLFSSTHRSDIFTQWAVPSLSRYMMTSQKNTGCRDHTVDPSNSLCSARLWRPTGDDALFDHCHMKCERRSTPEKSHPEDADHLPPRRFTYCKEFREWVRC